MMSELESLKESVNEKEISEISDRLNEYIIDMLENTSLGCLLNIQLERNIIHKFPSIEKNNLIKKTRDALFKLCKQGILDAIIPQNITKVWKIKTIPESEISAVENDQDVIKKINEGSYYSWEFEPFLSDSDVLFKYKDDSFDTLYILDNIPELFLEVLNVLRTKLDSNQKIGFKLIWVLNATRNTNII